MRTKYFGLGAIGPFRHLLCVLLTPASFHIVDQPLKKSRSVQNFCCKWPDRGTLGARKHLQLPRHPVEMHKYRKSSVQRDVTVHKSMYKNHKVHKKMDFKAISVSWYYHPRTIYYLLLIFILSFISEVSH